LATGAALLLLGSAAAPAAPDDWAEGSADREDGANRTHYNRGGQLPWRNVEGDWRDADDAEQGKKPFAAATIAVKPGAQPIDWDVTSLVRNWVSGKARNKGVLLRNTKGAGNFSFRSREFEEAEDRPRLLLTVNGKPKTFEAVADTYLVRSTYRAQGKNQTLRIEGTLPTLVRFDLSALNKSDTIDKATLRLVTFKQYSSGEVGVFACDQGEEVEATQPILGIAANHPKDQGIAKNPNVLFATGFEADDWKTQWTQSAGKVDTVAAHPENKFEPLLGKACRAHLEKGALTAMNMTYQFRKKIGAEPEQVYFRYYLRFGNDWQQTVQGGKMPGISGTYGKAGWGGRKVNGKDGWSARGSFGLTLPDNNPLAGKQPLGWYCYHADMEGNYGSGWIWTKGYRGFLDNNRWYCIEQYVKLNTPGQDGEPGARDGVLRVWVDGRPAFEKTDIRFRDVEDLKIEQIWMNVYHGGTVPSPRDQHLYVDNVVVAKKYIGPMQ
jgi:hypothetical protein